MIREYVVKVTDTFVPDAFQRFESEWAPEQEIVRCKDCKYRSFYCTEATDGTTLYECHHPCANSVPRPSDWYCADGERRKDDG